VQWEWEQALTLQKRLIPIVIVQCDVPGELATLHYHDFSDPGKYSLVFASLIRDLNRLKNGDTPSPSNIEVDRKLFLRITTELLPSSEVRAFTKEQHYQNPFSRKKSELFDEFLYQCQFPEFEFLDPELEISKAQLYSSAREFNNKLNKYIFTDDAEFYFVPSADREMERLMEPGRQYDDETYDAKYNKLSELYERWTQELNDAGSTVWDDYSQFIRQSRRKLGI